MVKWEPFTTDLKEGDIVRQVFPPIPKDHPMYAITQGRTEVYGIVTGGFGMKKDARGKVVFVKQTFDLDKAINHPDQVIDSFKWNADEIDDVLVK